MTITNAALRGRDDQLADRHPGMVRIR